MYFSFSTSLEYYANKPWHPHHLEVVRWNVFIYSISNHSRSSFISFQYSFMNATWYSCSMLMTVLSPTFSNSDFVQKHCTKEDFCLSPNMKDGYQWRSSMVNETPSACAAVNIYLYEDVFHTVVKKNTEILAPAR